MTLMLNHVDSPYIRCIGFLYLRYGTNPADIWERFHPYLYDDEPVRLSTKITVPEVTVGKFVRNLLTDMEYFGTLLPRFPVAVERDIKVKLMQAEKIEERALRHLQDRRVMSFFETIGSRIQALYGDKDNPVTWYDGVVDRVVRTDDETGAKLSRPKFLVTFPEYGNTELVSLGEIDMMQQTVHNDNDYLRNRTGSDNRNSGNSSKRDYDDRHYSGYHDKGYRRASNDFDQGYNSKRMKHDDSHDNNYRNGLDSGYDAPSSSFATRSRHIPNEKELMEEVLQRERDKSLAKGRVAYANRPSTFKESLSAPRHGVENRLEPKDFNSHRYEQAKRRENFPNDRKSRPNNEKDSTKGEPKSKQKTPEELEAIAQKKRQLLARYG